MKEILIFGWSAFLLHSALATRVDWLLLLLLDHMSHPVFYERMGSLWAQASR